MTLLTICQNAADDVGFNRPSTIIDNTASDAKQLLRFANATNKHISRFHKWNRLVKEDTITLVTSDQDYALASDFYYMIPDTCWNRNTSRPVVVSIDSEEWQFEKGWGVSISLNLRARIRANQLEFVNTISSDLNGEVIAYEYISNQHVLASGASTPSKVAFTVDTDTSAFDEEIVTMGVVYRYKKSKGLPGWEIDRMDYMDELKKLAGRDKANRTVNMQDPSADDYSRLPDRNYGI